MICRTCLRQAASAFPRITVPSRTFSVSLRTRGPVGQETTTNDPTPVTPNAPAAEPKAALSSCPKGTLLTGLGYFKGKGDLVAKADEEYPDWLWKCLEVTEKHGDAEDISAGDEFSKSKKQRRLAFKRQRQLEAKLLASGSVEALAPKIPLAQQSINLPGNTDGGLDDALAAASKRDELRKALRKDRKAKIKEANYLKSM
ncbi:hypothetical protein GQ53DRAFT_754551 [Thozetella sp. PMI_491]|nr:hypothetical protein GQ53DRAFT_754551 [Thozetella sp. PMI_491]